MDAEYDLDLDFSEPFYFPKITPGPPTSGRVERYIILKSLLEKPTNCSFIYKCADSLDNKIKVLKFIMLVERRIERIKNELMIMKTINHPNIIRMEDCFRYKEYICAVIPYTPHRSLTWFLTQHYRQGLPENMAVPIIYQILKAIEYLHLNDIWHRDVKPDNILLFDSDTNYSSNQYDPQEDTTNEPIIPETFTSAPLAVLSDLGFAKAFAPGEKCKDYLGTKIYFSPELAKKEEYDKSVDIWALGITMFVVLVADFPYDISRNYIEMIKEGHFDLSLFEARNISPDAQDLFLKMCAYEPENRITASDALKHPWILSKMKSHAEIEVINEIGLADQFQFIPGT